MTNAIQTLFRRKLDPRTSRRLAAVSRRSVGLPADARSARPTPATALLSLEAMASLVARVDGGRS